MLEASAPCVNECVVASFISNSVPGASHEPLFAPPAPVVLCCAAAAMAGPVVAQQPRAAARRPGARAEARHRRRRSAAPAPPPPPAGVQRSGGRTINGQPIRLSELEVAQQALPQQYRNMPLQAVFPALLDRIVDSKLVVQDGRKNKVSDDPAFKKRMAFVEEQVMQDFWLQREIAKQGHGRKAAAALRGAAEVDAGRGRGARAPHPGGRPRTRPRRSSPTSRRAVPSTSSPRRSRPTRPPAPRAAISAGSRRATW